MLELDRSLIEQSPLSDSQKKLLILIDVEGKGVVEVAKLLGRSKSTISLTHTKALKNYRKWQAELEVPRNEGEAGIRELDAALSASRSSLLEAIRGSKFLQQLKDLNISLDRLSSFVAVVGQYGDKAGQALEYALRLKQAEEKEGKSYEAVLAEFAEKSGKLREIDYEIEKSHKKKESIEESMPKLHQLESLKEKLDLHNLLIQGLDVFVDRHLKLDELGFSSHATEVLASELHEKGLNPEKASQLVSDMIADYGSTDTAASEMRKQKRALAKELHEISASLDASKAELGGTQEQVKVVKGQVEKWKQLVVGQEKLHQMRVRQLEDQASIRAQELQNQHERKKAGFAKEMMELEDRKEAIIKENKQLEAQVEPTQKALSELADSLRGIEDQINKWRSLSVVASVTSDPVSPLPPSEVSRAFLGIMGGLKAHIEANPKDYSQESKKRVEQLWEALARETRIAIRQAK